MNYHLHPRASHHNASSVSYCGVQQSTHLTKGPVDEAFFDQILEFFRGRDFERIHSRGTFASQQSACYSTALYVQWYLDLTICLLALVLSLRDVLHGLALLDWTSGLRHSTLVSDGAGCVNVGLQAALVLASTGLEDVYSCCNSVSSSNGTELIHMNSYFASNVVSVFSKGLPMMCGPHVAMLLDSSSNA